MALCIWLTGATGYAQPVRIDSVVTTDAYGHVKTYRPPGNLALPTRENFLTLFCSTARPATIEYRLVPLHAHWQQSQRAGQIHYANLRGGAYTLEIRPVSTPRLLTTLQLQLETPFWSSVWFWPLVVVYVMSVIGVVGYLFLQYRYRQRVRALKVRDRIARDLHDDMGSYLSSISILSAAMPADPARARQNLDKIGQTARHVMDAMSDIVWSINPAQDTMQQVLDRMKLVADELFQDTETIVPFAVGPGVEKVTLPLERRRDFFLIYKETMTNAARYAQATQVQVQLVCEAGRLCLTIQDNGQGFDPTRIVPRSGGGNGLKNVQIRAEALSGTLQIQSAVGQGTRLTLSLPV